MLLPGTSKMVVIKVFEPFKNNSHFWGTTTKRIKIFCVAFNFEKTFGDFNRFQDNVHFLYPLNTSENVSFLRFSGALKGLSAGLLLSSF